MSNKSERKAGVTRARHSRICRNNLASPGRRVRTYTRKPRICVGTMPYRGLLYDYGVTPAWSAVKEFLSGRLAAVNDKGQVVFNREMRRMKMKADIKSFDNQRKALASAQRRG